MARCAAQRAACLLLHIASAATADPEADQVRHVATTAVVSNAASTEALTTPRSATASLPLKVDDTEALTFLLLDPRNIIETSGSTELVLGAVHKEPANPLLMEEKPWELQFNNMQPSVWYDETDQLFKVWYNMFSTCEPKTARSCQAPKEGSACDSNMGYDAKTRTGSLCYAESHDGINFTKPKLGIVPFGSIPATETNILLGDAPSPTQPLSGGYPTGNGVTLDEHAQHPDERWKMLGCRPQSMFDAYLATSADGKHFSNGTQFVSGRFDTALNVEFDPYSRRWLAFARQQRTHVRSKMHSTIRYQSVAVSRNESFLGEWDTMLPTLLNTSTLSYQPDALVSFAYHGIFLGFANMLALSGNRSENGGSEGGTVNAELVWSADGRKWQYLQPGKSFIPLGSAGAWDSCSVFGAKQGYHSSQQRGPANSSMNVYYAGCNGPFMGPRACSLGLAKVQRHGWAGLQATSQAGAVVELAPTHVFSPILRLTVESTGTTGVQVAIKDDVTCSFNNSKPLIGTLSEHPVEWSGGCDLSEYVGGAARFLLWIPEGATAFAYTV